MSDYLEELEKKAKQVREGTAVDPFAVSGELSEDKWKSLEKDAYAAHTPKSIEDSKSRLMMLDAALERLEPESVAKRIKKRVSSMYGGEHKAYDKACSEILIQMIEDMDFYHKQHPVSRLPYRYLAGKYHKKVKRVSGLTFAEFVRMLAEQGFLIYMQTNVRKKNILFHYKEMHRNKWDAENRDVFDKMVQELDN